jgi:hypothetical protein
MLVPYMLILYAQCNDFAGFKDRYFLSSNRENKWN